MADSFIFRLSNEKHRPNFTPLPVYCFTYPPHKFLCHFFLALLILSGSHSFSKKILECLIFFVMEVAMRYRIYKIF